MTEQTQAEKLVIMDDMQKHLNVLKKELEKLPDSLTEAVMNGFNPERLAEAFATDPGLNQVLKQIQDHAADQATAELRAERDDWEKRFHDLAGGPEFVNAGGRSVCDLLRDLDKAQAQVKALREEFQKIIDSAEGRTEGINDPIDPVIKAYCEQLGYGAVMDSASRQWMKKDNVGAHIIAGCAGTIRWVLSNTQATADAYTAKIRQEAREKAVNECLEIMEKHFDQCTFKTEPGQPSCIMLEKTDQGMLEAEIESLLAQAEAPQAETEGGV